MVRQARVQEGTNLKGKKASLNQLSRVGSPYCQNMFVTTLYFCESTMNNFHLPSGMITPTTVLDIAAIVGLHPNGKYFNPNERDEDTINFDNNYAIFAKYILDHHDITTEEVLDKEHINFLAMWLPRFIFYFKSLKVAKRFLTLANMLHDGRSICLSQLILGSFYELLGLASESMKKLKPREIFLLVGSYWLLQLWLNAMFEPSLQINIPNDEVEGIKNKNIEGTRLPLMIYYYKTHIQQRQSHQDCS